MCDAIGPRKTFAACLLAGAVPTFCAGGVKNIQGLYVLRFFIGILGGSFVPCQVWSTGFFDKPMVGTANAVAAGLGNAGGGVTYFVMPAIYNSLVAHGQTSDHAWKISFVVPGILIVVVALGLLFCCPDTPAGKWADRFENVDHQLRRHDMIGVVDVPGQLSDTGEYTVDHGNMSDVSLQVNEKKEDVIPPSHDPEFAPNEAHLSAEEMMETAKGEVIRKPTFKEAMAVVFSLQTLVTGACYFCSFGAELSINSVLGNWYTYNFSKYHITTQSSGNYAAIFGLLNVICRPLGGVLSDYAYRKSGSLWAKKALLHTYGIITGGFLIAIGVLNSKNEATMIGLVAGMAFFLEGGNGMNYSLVPHVHPYANGIVSGFTGAMGNLGGIVFALIFRYNVTKTTTHWGKSVWIIGVITIALNIAVSWIRPAPKGQIGGH